MPRDLRAMDSEPSCPATMPIGDGRGTIDLMCWRQLGHDGAHEDPRGDEPVAWQTRSEIEAAILGV